MLAKYLITNNIKPVDINYNALPMGFFKLITSEDKFITSDTSVYFKIDNTRYISLGNLSNISLRDMYCFEDGYLQQFNFPEEITIEVTFNK